MSTPTFSLEVKSKNPFVVLPLKKYESLIQHIEDLEDKVALRVRKEEEDIPWSVVEKKFEKKFGKK